MPIPIGVAGEITNSCQKEPYVLVQNDIENTGGYLVLQSSDQAFTTRHDTWVEADKLDAFFRETGWNVLWSQASESRD